MVLVSSTMSYGSFSLPKELLTWISTVRIESGLRSDVVPVVLVEAPEKKSLLGITYYKARRGRKNVS